MLESNIECTNVIFVHCIGSKYENIDSTDDCLELCLEDFECVAINFKV